MRVFLENHQISYFSVRLWIETLFSTPDSGCEKKYAFHRVVDFVQYVLCIFMNYGSQESCGRDVQASFEGVAGEREELSFLSSPVRLPPSIDCPP